jgi:hypothetical protein
MELHRPTAMMAQNASAPPAWMAVTISAIDQPALWLAATCNRFMPQASTKKANRNRA